MQLLASKVTKSIYLSNGWLDVRTVRGRSIEHPVRIQYSGCLVTHTQAVYTDRIYIYIHAHTYTYIYIHINRYMYIQTSFPV